MLFQYFYQRPLLLKVVLGIAVVLGLVGYLRMPRSMYPDVERPQVMIVTQLPGATPTFIAKNVSRPLEQELYGLSRVRDVQSTNRNAVSIVRAEFDYEKGLEAALLDVNNALLRVRARLPAETQVPAIYPVGAFTQPVMVVAMSPKAPAGGANLTLSQLRLLAENDVRAALLRRGGIANVEVFGGYEPAVRVELDPFKLARCGVTAAELQEILVRTNRDLPVGNFQGATSSLAMTIYGERLDVARIRAIPITRSATLGDVATVQLAFADRYSAYHGNGHASIALAILGAPRAPVQDALQSAEGALPELRAQFPQVEFTVTETQGELIAESNSNMLVAMLHAIAFTSLVILFFLGNLRAVATALLSIPLVFLVTLGVLWLCGKELNILVMTGIILALGMLVDDAVVVLENIERHLRRRADVEAAVRQGTREVLFPLFAGTLATVVVIAPLMFIGDFPQQIFQHLVLTVVIAVAVSYFVSITFIPQLSRFWYRNGIPEPARLETLCERLYECTLAPGGRAYARALRAMFGGSVRRRVVVLLPAFWVLVLSMRGLLPITGREALPPMDTGNVRVHVRFGSNQTVAAAEERLQQFEARLLRDPRVRRVSAIFGSEPQVISLGSGQLPAEATLNITYVSRFERAASSHAIEAELRRELAAIPGVLAVDAFDSGPTALATIKAPIHLQLAAEDWRLLPAAAQRVQAALGAVHGLSSVSSTWNGYTAEVNLVLDEYKLRALGLTPAAVRAQLPVQGPQLGVLSQLPTVNALTLRGYLREPFGSNPYSLQLLPIRVSATSTVPLGEIARIVQQPGVSLLTTDALRYTIDVFGYRNTMPVSILSERALQAATPVLPAGVSIVDKGDIEIGTESTRRMLLGLGIGIVLLVGVLIPAYGSIKLALLSVLILPLSMIGAIWALLIFNKAFGMPAMLGVVLLCSIIIKNSILLMDFIQARRREGATAMAAALAAIELRYRPILMTALGTIAGMVPIAMQRAIGLERMSPLAAVSIGGLLIGTLLSLFYLPMLYVWVTRQRGGQTDAAALGSEHSAQAR